MAPKKRNADSEEAFDTSSDSVLSAINAVLLPELHKFDGEKGTSEAKEWLRSLDSQAKIAKWSDLQTLEAAKRLLCKAAKSWYLLTSDEIKTWKDFRREFYESFIGSFDQENVLDKFERFASYTQNKQSTEEYVFEKLRLAKDVGATVRETKGALCDGLKSSELTSYLRNFDYEVVSDYLKRIREFDRIKSNNTAVNKNVQYNQRVKDGKEQQPTKQGDSEETMVYCFNCRKKADHISKNCPEPRRPKYCSICKKEGHSKKECTVSQISKEVPSSTNSKSLVGAVTDTVARTDNSGQKYIKTAFIGDQPVLQTEVDAGSRVCLIRATEAIKLGVKIEHSKSRIFGVGNLEIGTEVLGTIVAPITIDNITVNNIEVLIVADNVLPSPMLVGRTYTENPKVATVKWKNSFVVLSADNKLFNELPLTESLSESSCIGDNDGKNIVNFVHSEPMKLTCEHFQFGENLSEVNRTRFIDVLNKYRGCFALNIYELGKAKLPPIDIEIVPGSAPAASKPYRTSAEDAAEMSRQIAEWREVGIVVDTTSPYAAPGFLVGKKDGKKRPVFDFRKLNNQVVKIHYPLPNVDDHLQGLAEEMVFCVLDLSCGYLQIPLTLSAQDKTAFVTTNETGQFTVLPFGYTNAPSEFQQRMTYVWRRLKYVRKYLDDTLVPAKGIEELLQRLEEVLQTLLEYNLTCRPEKCKIAVEVVEFLGFEIGRGEIRPGSNKTKAIAQFPVPTDIHELRRFVGLTSFFRRFIKKFATRISPLTDLTKKNCPFEWTTAQQAAFNEIRQALTERPVLKLFNAKAITELHTDASQHGLAGLLLQKTQPDAPLHLVYAVSRKTTDQERVYHSSKLELLAIVWSITRLRQYLLGISFTMVTDCQALLHLNSRKTANPQIARWALLLQEYDFLVRHRKGELMQHADALSRAPLDSPIATEEEIEKLGVFRILDERDVVRMHQSQDEKIANIIRNIEYFPKFKIADRLLYRIDEETNRDLYVIPNSMRKALCIQHHDSMGHFSLEKVIDAIRTVTPKESTSSGQLRNYRKWKPRKN